MKVWLVHQDSYGETSVYAETVSVVEVPCIKAALSQAEADALEDEYFAEAIEEFKSDLDAIRANGEGSTTFNDYYTVELLDMIETV